MPPERQLPAPATIAGPAALQYALLDDGDEVSELRDMFETLLAKSMDIETAANVHPAFVSMISQITPDEARILKSITQDDYAAVDLFSSTAPTARSHMVSAPISGSASGSMRRGKHSTFRTSIG